MALLLETTDTGDIAFLHERARKTADASYLAVDDGKVAVKDAGSCHAVA